MAILEYPPYLVGQEPRIQYEVEVRFQILTVAPGIKDKLRLVAGPRIAGYIGIVLEVELSRERHIQKGHDRNMNVSGASETTILLQPRHTRRNGVSTRNDRFDLVAAAFVGQQHSAQMERHRRLDEIARALLVVKAPGIRLPNLDERFGKRRAAIRAVHRAGKYQTFAGLVIRRQLLLEHWRAVVVHRP